MSLIEKIKAIIRGSIDLSKLEKNGFVHGKNFHAQQGVIVDPGHCWLISVGDNVTLAPNVHILAHDASTKIPLGMTKIGRVKIGNNVFVGANTVVLPNVVIGNDVIIGAGSVVTCDLSSPGIYYGIPARKVYDYDQWVEKEAKKMATAPKYDSAYIIGNITDEMRYKMREELDKMGPGFIV